MAAVILGRIASNIRRGSVIHVGGSEFVRNEPAEMTADIIAILAAQGYSFIDVFDDAADPAGAAVRAVAHAQRDVDTINEKVVIARSALPRTNKSVRHAALIDDEARQRWSRLAAAIAHRDSLTAPAPGKQ